MDLQTISALASAGFFVATYLIVQPLKLSINALQISVDRLATAMEKVQVEVNTCTTKEQLDAIILE